MMIETTLKHKTPMMLCAFVDADLEKIASGMKAPSLSFEKGDPRKEAAKRLYISTRTGQPVMPQANIMACLLAAAKMLKVNDFNGCIDIEEDEVPIESEGGWEVDVRSAVIPATKGRVKVCRPIFYDWAITFTIGLDTEIIGEQQFRDIVNCAGRRVGLGAFRPNRGGPYGRFEVSHWTNLQSTDEPRDADPRTAERRRDQQAA